MNIPSHLLYSKTDEWILVEGDVATIGVTDFAQGELGDIVFLELPESGAEIVADEMFGVVESIKAASDLIAPVTGEVLQSNKPLEKAAEAINKAPYDNWLIKVKLADKSQLDELMDAAAYEAYLKER
ncbi:MAG: glycine cleavage system protein GcvH [Armatimonadota bacterium]